MAPSEKIDWNDYKGELHLVPKGSNAVDKPVIAVRMEYGLVHFVEYLL